MTWKTSTYSVTQETCVEINAPWRTSTYSAETTMCVEVATGPVQVKVRDSKDRPRGHFAVTGHAWTAFLNGIR